MATSVVRPYHTLDSHHFQKNSGRRKCRCCPYGYHIDLDFVRYCETIASSQLLSDIPVRKSRWNVRKRRASKETLLGIAVLPQLSDDSSKASQDVGDDLQKAVLDFEKVLISSARSSSSKSRNSSKCKDWLISKDGDDQMVVKKYCTRNQNDVTKICENFIQDDSEHNFQAGANNASPQMLQIIRKQMATSLGRMRELEDEVKVIPNLQAHISNLEKENKRLLDQLEKERNNVKIKKTELIDAATATSQICHTRNVGIGCTVMTREIGISSVVRMVSCGTESCGTIEQPDHNENNRIERPCLISLENIIGTPSKLTTKNVATSTERLIKALKDATTETELKFKKNLNEDELRKILSMKTELEEKTVKRSKTVGTVTELRGPHIYTKADIDKLKENSQTEKNLKKVVMVNASEQTPCYRLETRESSIQTLIPTSDIGVTAKVNLTDNWVQMVKSSRDAAVSNHTINDPCFKCSVKKVSIATQNTIEKKQITLRDTSSQNTDTSDLFKLKDQGVNTAKRKLVNTGCDARDIICTKCNNSLETESNSASNQPKSNRPSYLPIPTHSHSKSRIPRASSSSSKKLRSEDYGSDSGSDDGVGYIQQNEDENIPRLDTFSTFHPIQSKSYKKEPSKEMKGALKVLNDALQKYSSDNFPKHMRNAVNIVQQEWFKVSSVADANPLDVEDYLDCFEEISSTLLEYIVNMTDVSGNTAMHYAVSNGNFDVVSILLDSKVCNINKMNTAGYTCIMLVALTKVKSETDRQVVRRLFHMADVNIRAKQHGQTALMLAVSHGRIDTVELLLESGADINIQDEDGSTALMCAAEHGYIDIVKLLLTQPDCDLTITDYDGSTALAIAMDAGNRDIGVLLYAQEHFSRGGSPFTPSKNHRRAKSATPTLRGATPTPSSLEEVPH
ncbi:hypothetical protein O3M35_003785 [Rhynocoris fuscipes]|uniref:KN motif and ankyrin repeat domain-containing protein 1 n=1 Tax=Rhynocoris fuscipes TaxID=488301 RepID=A0AAW1CK90_9HEMI